MNSFYNAPELAEFMKSKKIDCVGTLHANMKNVNSALRNKKLKKEKHCDHSGRCGSSCVAKQEVSDYDIYIP
jgi:hypothetical protein